MVALSFNGRQSRHMRAFPHHSQLNSHFRSSLATCRRLSHRTRQFECVHCSSHFHHVTSMADIPQWRRKIPPSRSRTPMLEFTEPDQDTRSAAPTRPTTPKKGLRPKLSSYLSQSGPFGATSKPEPEPLFTETPAQTFPSWAVEDTFPNPSAEQLLSLIHI